MYIYKDGKTINIIQRFWRTRGAPGIHPHATRKTLKQPKKHANKTTPQQTLAS